MSTELLIVGAADAMLALAGSSLVWPLATRLRMPLVPRGALSFLAGIALLSLVTTVVGVVGGPTTAMPVIGVIIGCLAALGLVFVAGSFLRWLTMAGSRRDGWRRRGPEGYLEWAGYAVTIVVAVPFIRTGWLLPVTSNDEFMMWAFRGKMLAGGHLDPRVFGGEANAYAFQSREYPLGLPAIYSWMSGWVGPDMAEYAAHTQIALIGMAGLLVAVWAFTAVAGPVAGFLIAPGFFTATQVGTYTGILYFGDLPVAAAGLATIALLLVWLDRDGLAWLFLAAVPAVAAVYLKVEGELFVLAAVVAAIVVAWWGRAHRRRRWYSPALVAGIALVALAPWTLWLSAHGVHSRFVGGQKWGVLPLGELARRSVKVLGNMAGFWPVHFSTWWALGAVALGFVLAALVPGGRRPVAFLGVTLSLIVAGLWAQYVLYLLRGPYPMTTVDSYMKFNTARVELLPAVLGWAVPAVAVAFALARRRDVAPRIPAPSAPLDAALPTAPTSPSTVPTDHR